ncbi:MAG: ABC transporter permease [Alphaproteobacteria bacterium]|nr:ABC transporter permease [Alphaproteobacteria bacterium]
MLTKLKSLLKSKMSPVSLRRIEAFQRNRRAVLSFKIFWVVFVLSLFSELICNDKPLILKYNNQLYFPVLNSYTDADFGGDFPTPADYKDKYLLENIEKDGWIVWPVLPFSFNTVDYELDVPTPAAPSRQHWLGTDDEGRDIVARILYGIRLSVVFAFLLTLISSAIGIAAGAVQGYFGGKTDLFMQRILEIWEALPQLFVLIIVASIFTPTFFSLLFILIFFSWMSLTGVVRAEFLRARNLEFVLAAKALGVSNWRIIYRHILPNAIIATITFVPFIMSGAIVSLTALDFLGFGLPYDYPSLGDLVRQGKDNLQAPWIGISIFIVLSSLLTLLIFIGEGVRDAFDARKNG